MRFSDLDLVRTVPMHLWRALTEIDSVAFVHVDLDGRIQYANAGIARVLGYRPEEVIGLELETLLPDSVRDDHANWFSAYVRGRSAGETRCSGIVRRTRHFPRELATNDGKALRFAAVHRSGHEVPVSLTVNEVRSRTARLSGFVGLLIDCSERQALQDRVDRQAMHDVATGLLNWRGLHETVVALDRDKRLLGEPSCFSLLHVHIDHFSSMAFDCKAVADHALKAAAQWLAQRIAAASLPEPGHVARASGATQFLVYLPGCEREEAVCRAEALRHEFRIINLGSEIEPFHTSLSIGVISPQPGMTVDYAISRAAHACQQAQLRGHDRVTCVEPGDVRVYEMGQTIRKALRGDCIEAHAQRLVPLRSRDGDTGGEPLSFEVLCRLKNRHGAFVDAGLVFPAAEKLGLTLELDLHMIDVVLHKIGRYLGGSVEIDHCSINLSGISLSSEQLFQRVRERIVARAIPAEILCFEITESSRVRDLATAVDNVRRLRSLGCRIALDDFGSGYSNFQSLSNWPIDIVKIDGSYIRRLLDGGAMSVDIEGMVASAKARGIEIVAEYVESEAVVEALCRLGVDYAQGYRYHRAEPLDEFLATHIGSRCESC